MISPDWLENRRTHDNRRKVMREAGWNHHVDLVQSYESLSQTAINYRRVDAIDRRRDAIHVNWRWTPPLPWKTPGWSDRDQYRRTRIVSPTRALLNVQTRE